MRRPSNGTGALLATLGLALVLMILPLPEGAQPYRPQWALLIVMYWALALPHRVAVGVAWLIGLLQDVLVGALLGQHAAGFAIVGFLIHHTHLRLRVFPMWQQTVAVLVLLALEHMVSFWALGAANPALPGLEYWLVPLIGALLWPWLFLVMRDLRRRFHVS